jgi:thioredoxin 1
MGVGAAVGENHGNPGRCARRGGYRATARGVNAMGRETLPRLLCCGPVAVSGRAREAWRSRVPRGVETCCQGDVAGIESDREPDVRTQWAGHTGARPRPASGAFGVSQERAPGVAAVGPADDAEARRVGLRNEDPIDREPPRPTTASRGGPVGDPGETSRMANVNEVTDQTFDAEILQSSVPAIVDFWAEWCGPCRAIAPIIADLAASYGGKIKVVKMNVDENPSTPARYGVRAIPTILAFRGGQVVEQITGARPKAAFEQMATKLIG